MALDTAPAPGSAGNAGSSRGLPDAKIPSGPMADKWDNHRFDIKLVNPAADSLEKGPGGLLHLKSGGTAEADAQVTLISGSLEQSNVNVAKTLVNMIELARQYEMQVNVIKASEENADAAASLMRLGG